MSKKNVDGRDLTVDSSGINFYTQNKVSRIYKFIVYSLNRSLTDYD